MQFSNRTLLKQYLMTKIKMTQTVGFAGITAMVLVFVIKTFGIWICGACPVQRNGKFQDSNFECWRCRKSKSCPLGLDQFRPLWGRIF